jgi:CO dehydrogenase maturation factor
MKLAVTGKGGVGKTTLSALLAEIFAREGRRVLAIDANPDANLASALGLPAETSARIVPIAEMADLIEERTGVKPGRSGGFFRLNPRVEDIPERFSARKDSIWLLVMGTVKSGGGGCLCPESALLSALLQHLLIQRDEVVVLDMDAGVEHLGRATAKYVDAFVIVVEAGQRSLQTAATVKRLALDLGITRCLVAGSKTRSEAERRFIQQNIPPGELLGFINYHPEIAQADLQGKGVFDASTQAVQEAMQIKDRLEVLLGHG